MDILFLKSVEELHNINTLEYSKTAREKFKQRTLFWKADEDDTEEDI